MSFVRFFNLIIPSIIPVLSLIDLLWHIQGGEQYLKSYIAKALVNRSIPNFWNVPLKTINNFFKVCVCCNEKCHHQYSCECILVATKYILSFITNKTHILILKDEEPRIDICDMLKLIINDFFNSVLNFIFCC